MIAVAQLSAESALGPTAKRLDCSAVGLRLGFFVAFFISLRFQVASPASKFPCSAALERTGRGL